MNEQDNVQRMADSEMLWVFLVIFTVFTIVIGVIFEFYNHQYEVNKQQVEGRTPVLSLLNSSSFLVMILMLIAGVLIFLVAMAKAMTMRDS
jgi:uncharacterized membrane protein YidH (DUF202 family)